MTRRTLGAAAAAMVGAWSFDSRAAGSWLRRAAQEGLRRRLAAREDRGEKLDRASYDRRLEEELRAIADLDLEPAFATMFDVARDLEGSGASFEILQFNSFLAAFALGLTAIDPVRHRVAFDAPLLARPALARPWFLLIDISPEQLPRIVTALARCGATLRKNEDHQFGPDGAELVHVGAHLELVLYPEPALVVVDDCAKAWPADDGSLDDPATLMLLRRGVCAARLPSELSTRMEAAAIFGVESFEELAASDACSRWCEDRESLAAMKRGEHGSWRVHPIFDEIVEGTCGVVLYIEQLFEIATRMAGYSVHEADELRRAVGKKRPEEIAHHRHMFLSRCLLHGVFTGTASHAFSALYDMRFRSKCVNSGMALRTYRMAYAAAPSPGPLPASPRPPRVVRCLRLQPRRTASGRPARSRARARRRRIHMHSTPGHQSRPRKRRHDMLDELPGACEPARREWPPRPGRSKVSRIVAYAFDIDAVCSGAGRRGADEPSDCGLGSVE